ncbi:MAG: hypothetical protein E3K32_07675 [wastewater metagenome]|nr:hypothetical protein [Candidatus Loosdrechtia aerotolerans]
MNDKRDAGYVVIVVTVILVAMLFMGMTFLNLTSIDFTATDNYVNNRQAEMIALSGLEYAIYVLKMDKYGTDSVVYNDNTYPYIGTTTQGTDESYDVYTEEWLGTGTDKIFCNSLPNEDGIDNNSDDIPDSRWIDVPFSLDKGLKAQYAILIEDIGGSRINVNATGNIVGTSGAFFYGTGATTYDIRLQDVLGTVAAKGIVVGSDTGRCGVNSVPGSTGTTASQYQPRNPVEDDRPFGILDAADICFGTYTPSSVFQSRLRAIMNSESLFQSKRNILTVYSFDTVIHNHGTGSLLLPDNKNYYRLKLDDAASVDTIIDQLQVVGFSEGTATQLAVNSKDYMDADSDITAYGTGTKYGLEPHPFINELYHTGTHSAYPCQHRIELYNPFNIAVGSETLSINGSKMELLLKVTKEYYSLNMGYPACDWVISTVSDITYPINMDNFSIQPKGYLILGYDEPGAFLSIPTLSGTQTVTGFNVYDYDSTYVPLAVTVTLMGSSSALNSGDYLILDKAEPNAYKNKINGEDVLWLLYDLIAFIYYKTQSPGNDEKNSAYESLLAKSGDGVWDGDPLTPGPQHTTEPPYGSNALTELVEPDKTSDAYWDPGTNGIDNAISTLTSLINSTNNFVSNEQINADSGAKIIADAEEIQNLLEKAKCDPYLNVRASIGERKNPLVERSDNWGTATPHTLGQVNFSYGSVTANERKQLVISNKNIISLGEMGHLLTVGYGTQSSYTNNVLYNIAGSSTVDNAKLNLVGSPGNLISEYFTIIDPKDDTIDDDADGATYNDTGTQTGDIDGPEIQVPGRININTAPSEVLAALPGTDTGTSLGTWDTLIQSAKGYSLISNIIDARPFSTVGTITGVTGMDYFATDTIDNDGDGLVDEKDEKDLIFTAISNLITTHSNVFAIYVTARIINTDGSQTMAEKKLVAIVDRSVTPVKIRYFRWMTEW